MVRLGGFLLGALFCVVLLFAATRPRDPAVPVEHGIAPMETSWSFDGPLGHGVFGKFDNRQLQRGFQVYTEVCSACHSMKLVAFRDLQQIGFSAAEVKAIAKKHDIPTIDPASGDPSTRKGLPSDYILGPYANEVAARAANNNALPPDMSLLAKAREGGARYIWSLVGHGYVDPPKGHEVPDGLYYNKYYANLNIAMPPPLASDDQVTYTDGTKGSKDQFARDMAAFLMWAAEPKLAQRHETGLDAVLFLAGLTVLLFLTYKAVWKDVKKPGREMHPAE